MAQSPHVSPPRCTKVIFLELKSCNYAKSRQARLQPLHPQPPAARQLRRLQARERRARAARRANQRYDGCCARLAEGHCFPGVPSWHKHIWHGSNSWHAALRLDKPWTGLECRCARRRLDWQRILRGLQQSKVRSTILSTAACIAYKLNQLASKAPRQDQDLTGSNLPPRTSAAPFPTSKHSC